MSELIADVVAYHAGSLTRAANDLGAAFTAATGFSFHHVGGPSVTLAEQIASGEIHADVFMSADAEVNDEVLMGAVPANKVRWYFLMARQRMVLMYSPISRFVSELEAAAAGRAQWYEVLQHPGFVLQRSDPRNDPGGYRGVFVIQLAERHYAQPGLAASIFGPAGPNNENQIATRTTIEGLRGGGVDGLIGYLTGAIGLGLPYITLPDEVDQGNPALADFYASAAYTTPHGQQFHGTPLAYSVSIPVGSHNQSAAEAFVRHLVTEPGQAILERHGFGRVQVLVGGDRTSVPYALQELIQGTYTPLPHSEIG
jgi:molybdate/tungstate transport system substrate-binding protein